MKQYKDLINHILTSGQTKEDRTGTGTLSVFGYQTRFDLQQGFPAITTKKLAWKSVVSELLWFMKGSTDERVLSEILHGNRYLLNKTTIWTDNAQSSYWKPNAAFNGDLSHVYGYQWRKFPVANWQESTTLIKKSTFVGNDDPFEIKFETVPKNKHSQHKDIGKLYTQKSFDVKVLDVKDDVYLVQLQGGSKAVLEVTKAQLKSKKIKDPFELTQLDGTGCMGIVDTNSPSFNEAYKLWINIYKSCKEGNKKLHSDWKCFSNFFRDIHTLPGFSQWKFSGSMAWRLSTEYYCSDWYSVDTTIFLPSKYQLVMEDVLYTAEHKHSDAVFKFTCPSILDSLTNSWNCIKSEDSSNSNWDVTVEQPPEGYVYRQKFYTDQLSTLIEEIKTNPSSRRLILSAWNPSEIDNMALPPCHVLAQFNVVNNKLSCQLYQRSVDAGLGLPFNIASYALLTHILAKICNLEVGEFIHTSGDLHIYNDHIEPLELQISRTPYDLPTLEIPNFTSLDDVLNNINLDDYVLKDYNHHSTIKMNMAV